MIMWPVFVRRTILSLRYNVFFRTSGATYWQAGLRNRKTCSTRLLIGCLNDLGATF